LTSSEFAARGGIAGRPPLPRFEKLLRPAVIEVLDDPFATAKFGDALLTAQAFQHNPDLVFGGKVSPRRATDVLHDLCRRPFLRHRFLSHLCSFEEGYDEPEILPSST
jgi:hypothetical protein